MTLRVAWAACVAAVSLAVVADDGMWTYHDPPLDLLRSKYKFEPTRDWLHHLQLASLSTGASASFLSPDGLYLTNAHVALDCVKNLSTPSEDLVASGFLARARRDERPCPGVEARQLVSYADVTARVDAPQATERRARIAAVEKECREATALRCEVVTLYRGAQYWVYRYKVWSDVRLVFIPESEVAFFGGDTDNFVFPRFDLDMALLRAYEDGRPARTPEYLRVAKRGAAEGDLVFSSGSPGSTDRALTLAELRLVRDRERPLRLASMVDLCEALNAYSNRSDESARRALSVLQGAENYLKALKGESRALARAGLMQAKASEEEALRAKADEEVSSGRFRWTSGDPWQRIDRAVALHASLAAELEGVDYGYGSLLRAANDLVALAYEGRKPDGERLENFREARAARLRRRLAGDSVWHKDLEVVRISSRIREAARILPPDHPFLARLQGNDDAATAAGKLVAATHLDQAAERRKLLEGGAAAVDASSDPLIAAARNLYPRWSQLRRTYENDIVGEQEKGYDEIARLRAHLGTRSHAPDASETLRFAFGVVRGYDRDGVLTPWATTFHGLYDRHAALASHRDFRLPQRWTDAAARVRLDTPFNFVTTVDIIGGSSGSPLVNRDGELVGVLFDGNLEELGNRFAYSETVARSIAVDVRAMVEALDKVYGAQEVLHEIGVR